MKYKVVTLGCRTNQYESQAYVDQLKSAGFAEASMGEGADICIVNTCTVTEQADQRSLKQIKSLIKKNPGAEIVVTGCMAERKKSLVREIPGVTQIVPNEDKEKLLSLVYPEKDFPEFSIKRFDGHTRAFVKIQDGCNSYCSYCIIPFVRGRSRSKKASDILREIEDLVANGYREIVLTGINIGDFDGAQDPPMRLHELVHEVQKVPGLERIRISSIDPDEVDDTLLRAVVTGEKMCQSMHIVLQSGSNGILKSMRRKYTRQDFFDAVSRLRNASPDFTFTTDVIVGFPGETEADFMETLDVMSEVQFAKVHMFPYSDRPKTRASRMEGKVPHDVMQERKQRLMRHDERLSYQLRERFLGRSMRVLLESSFCEEWIHGHTGNFLPIKIPKLDHTPNTFVDVELVENSPDGLIGKEVVYAH